MTSDESHPSQARKTAVRRPTADRTIGRQIVQAVRNSLNLPALTVRVRRSKARGVWLVRLVEEVKNSEWLELDLEAVAVAASVGVLPPRLLGTFRLAYDSLGQSEAKRQRTTRLRSS